MSGKGGPTPRRAAPLTSGGSPRLVAAAQRPLLAAEGRRELPAGACAVRQERGRAGGGMAAAAEEAWEVLQLLAWWGYGEALLFFLVFHTYTSTCRP